MRYVSCDGSAINIQPPEAGRRSRVKGIRTKSGRWGFLLFFLLTTPFVHAQDRAYVTPDVVVSFTQGEGGGRGSDYMPQNILGLPDTVGRTTVATIDPKQILSFGLDGEIVLRFDRALIVDGPGVDFTVFENAFHYRLGGEDRIYAEPGEVAVSRDGVEYVSFPYDPQTLQGCAGVTPTQGDQSPNDPAVSGGDGFDLAGIDIDSIRFIRIRDVTRMVKENSDHPFYDVTLNGFDLDAIVAINAVTSGVSGVRDLAEIDGVDVRLPTVVYSADIPLDLILPASSFVRVRLSGMTGKELGRIETEVREGGDRLQIPARELPSGVYFLTITAEGIGTASRTIRLLR